MFKTNGQAPWELQNIAGLREVRTALSSTDQVILVPIGRPAKFPFPQWAGMAKNEEQDSFHLSSKKGGKGNDT